MIVVATAGWSIPRLYSGRFAADGTHLHRYAQVLPGAEINSAFYRTHARETYARWAAQTPRSFKFSVKLPRLITHDARLRSTRGPLDEFLESVGGLGRKLGPLIVQLPPSLAFETRIARGFFTLLRQRHDGPVVCEPRHPTWFDIKANVLLEKYRIARVAADPAIVPTAAEPGGWAKVVYYRLHGSPQKYWSVYETSQIAHWAHVLKAVPRDTLVWCVFDNTAAGGATENALRMHSMIDERSVQPERRA